MSLPRAATHSKKNPWNKETNSVVEYETQLNLLVRKIILKAQHNQRDLRDAAIRLKIIMAGRPLCFRLDSNGRSRLSDQDVCEAVEKVWTAADAEKPRLHTP